MLQCRRQEKNFLLRRDEEYATRFQSALGNAKASLNYIAGAGDTNATARDREIIAKSLEAYGISFTRVVNIERKVGLTESDGLRAVFIGAARAMERKLKALDKEEALIALLQVRRHEKNYLIRGTQVYVDKTNKEYNRLVGLVDDMILPEGTKLDLKATLTAYYDAFRELVQAKTQATSFVQQFIENGRKLEPAVKALRDHFQAEEERIQNMVDYWIVGIEVAVAAILGIISLWVFFGVTKPLKVLTEYSHAVSTGDLDSSADGKFSKEFDMLRNDISTMVEQLKLKLEDVREQRIEAQQQAENARKAMEEAKRQEQEVRLLWERMQESAVLAEDFSGRVARSAEELAAMIEQVQQGAQVQTQRMRETSTAMEQMNAAVFQVAKNASDASTNAQDAKEKATRGAELVECAVKAIAVVNEHTDHMRDGMQNLERQVESIGEIMDVINEIADQTNLLALNAAIEAARAGEAGKGFAVVADEVRKLAEKTMQATQEVDRSIHSIREATGDNIRNMHDAVEAVEESTRLATESGQSQQEIVQLVQANTMQVTDIASAAEQQSASAEQINQAVDEVNTIAQESLTGMNSSFEAVSALTGLSEELMEMIQDMLRTDSDRKSEAATELPVGMQPETQLQA
ncbi:methyl-accepting chemotaxis protein [Pseudodesulfovibrio tunisiensis]|uniref:methyl-accepting chemotaxis protein n=1 Tax=Pseudodesulfovibrio tunisiensis TaxID=463192 RepID=UPI001FB3FB08|nr:methyl-accepting chemotaxis protein [Pseudodesulfovibrio tunisiensis]